MSVTDLNKEQQRAFNRLKKAYNDCQKLGVHFVNRYSSLYAFDSKLICGFGDMSFHAEGVSEISVLDAPGGDSLKIANEWSDDDGWHYYGLTQKGHEMYFDDELDEQL